MMRPVSCYQRILPEFDFAINASMPIHRPERARNVARSPASSNAAHGDPKKFHEKRLPFARAEIQDHENGNKR